MGNIQRVAHSPDRLLLGISALIDGIGRVDPAGGHRVDPYLPGKADRKSMGQGRNAALGRRIALGLRLAHAVPGRGNIDDACPLGKIRCKQLAQVGPSGEIIMDYSIHDALEAGFNKIVFIIRRDLEKDFKEIIGNRIEKICKVEYAFQESDNLPGGFVTPAERKKPWGTGHAILSTKGIVNEPFLVINADDMQAEERIAQLVAK